MRIKLPIFSQNSKKMRRRIFMKEKNAKQNTKDTEKKIAFHPTMKADSRIDTDPMGSWTGTPDDINEIPIQDVDDL